MLHLNHPDVHMAASNWSEDQDQVIHIAACYSNPYGWATRRQLANDFRRHMMSLPNVRLHLIEVAYGDRPFDVANPDLYPDDIALRTKNVLFHKENLLNIAISRFPSDWKYGAIVDADVHFTRHDIGLATIHQLQHHQWVQMFSSYQFLSGETVPGQGHRPIGNLREGFAYLYHHNNRTIPYQYKGGWGCPPYSTPIGKGIPAFGGTGLAWAFRREAFDAVGGLLDRCILGSGDWFMAFGLAGQTIHANQPMGKQIDLYHPHYLQYIQAWQQRAAAFQGNIGYVDCFAVHHFHGPIVNRGYGNRDQILINHKYNPTTDVFPDWQGVLQLSMDKPKLRDDIRQYFISRNEDEPHNPK